jgi:hypothetical protein
VEFNRTLQKALQLDGILFGPPQEEDQDANAAEAIFKYMDLYNRHQVLKDFIELAELGLIITDDVANAGTTQFVNMAKKHLQASIRLVIYELSAQSHQLYSESNIHSRLTYCMNAIDFCTTELYSPPE